MSFRLIRTQLLPAARRTHPEEGCSAAAPGAIDTASPAAFRQEQKTLSHCTHTPPARRAARLWGHSSLAGVGTLTHSGGNAAVLGKSQTERGNAGRR